MEQSHDFLTLVWGSADLIFLVQQKLVITISSGSRSNSWKDINEKWLIWYFFLRVDASTSASGKATARGYKYTYMGTRIKYTRMWHSPLDILIRNCHTLRSVSMQVYIIIRFSLVTFKVAIGKYICRHKFLNLIDEIN